MTQKNNGQFKAGQPRHPLAGRKPGQPNKLTKVMRDEWLEAYERKGGVEFLMGLEDDTFAKGLLRLIPNEVAASVVGDLTLRVIDRSDTRKDDDGVA